MDLATQIDRILHPDRYPIDHPQHDPEHPFWTGRDEDRITGSYQWDADTLDWIAEVTKTAMTERESA